MSWRVAWIPLTVLILGFPSPADGRKDDGGSAGRIDALIAKEFPADEPGAAVLVIRDGKVVLAKGYGLAHLNPNKPITPTTNFDLASMSKQFTALAVMLLADRGELSFDDDVRKYLPELAAPDGPRPVRIRDLLNQTSGLPDYIGFWKSMFDDFSKLTNEGVVRLLKDRKPKPPPGTKFKYSNTNYALLPVIVHRVTHRRFGEFMHDAVFRPLGMDRTVVVDDLAIMVPDRATGYRKAGKTWQVAAEDGPVCGDGNVFSNLRDLEKWDAAVGKKLAKPATWRLALSPGKSDSGTESNYGFGWVIETRGGRRVVWHNGGWAGTRTVIARWPDDHVMIVVLSNNEHTKPERVEERIADVVFGK